MAIVVIGVLWGILGILVGIIWNDNKAKIKALELQTSNLEKRVQAVEDIQGTAIVNLEKKFEKLEQKVDILNDKLNELSVYITKTSSNELRILQALEEFNKK